MASSLQVDMNLGTIEQIYVSTPSVLSLLSVRAAIMGLFNVFYSLPILVIGAHFLGVRVFLEWFVLISIPMFLSLYGLGLILAGLTLRYRRIGALTNILYVVILAIPVINVPHDEIGGLIRLLLPIIDLSNLSISNLSDLFIRLPTSFFYLWLGIKGFRSLEKQAKKHGVIGHY